MDLAIDILILLTLIGSSLIGGVFFIFSNTVMPALSRSAPAEGMRTMQAVNTIILNPGFLGAFLGTAVLSLAAIALGITGPSKPGNPWLIAGGLLYFVGTFIVTGTRNVPLNDRLAKADADAAPSAALWSDYLARWTRWKTLRTVTALLAAVCFGLRMSA